MTQTPDLPAPSQGSRVPDSLFERAPGFIAIFHGPEHRWVFANRAFQRLFPGRVIIGGRVRDSFPEAESQGFPALMDHVYTTGERFVGEPMHVTLDPADGEGTRELFRNFIYEPIRDAAGAVTGIFLDGIDVTARACRGAAPGERGAPPGYLRRYLRVHQPARARWDPAGGQPRFAGVRGQ